MTSMFKKLSRCVLWPQNVAYLGRCSKLEVYCVEVIYKGQSDVQVNHVLAELVSAHTAHLFSHASTFSIRDLGRLTPAGFNSQSDNSSISGQSESGSDASSVSCLCNFFVKSWI